MSFLGSLGARVWRGGQPVPTFNSVWDRIRNALPVRAVKAQIPFRHLPSSSEAAGGYANDATHQETEWASLLGRDPVRIDLDAVRDQIHGQAILVTGAAGTIGMELCRQILRFTPSKLVCVDRNENGIFYLQLEVSAQRRKAQVAFCVADVGDGERMRRILEEHRPAAIFHAAAYKHVPMMESNVYEAVKNNVFALLQLLEVAEDSGCRRFVLISSDKAVNPVNIMGATKRVGELLIACRPARFMRCVSVRFGNVLGSNGSVVPILQKQLRDRRALTITHPDVTRFFMTTEEAVSLALEAFAIGNHGDTMLLEMGNPVRILDLAKTLIRLSGKSEPEVEICFTGLRAGEKLAEELSYAWEEIHPTSSPKIGRIRGAPLDWESLSRSLDQLYRSM
jgi:FlaA1/EpsC-like NDP-sugar epimerase